MSFNNTLKIALENTVLCARTNLANESYDYAKKMELAVRDALKRDITKILENDSLEDQSNLLERFMNNL
jgi:hypothetical protein